VGDRVFKVCDQKTNDVATCDARDTKTCVVCERDFCPQHRQPTGIDIYVNPNGTSLCAFTVGVACAGCKKALASLQVKELFQAITLEEIIKAARAYLASEGLK
jgi:hypothetical protein